MRILKIMVFLGVVLSIFSAAPTYAKAPVRELKDYSPRELVTHFAKQYQVSESVMTATIRCESNFNHLAVGDHGKSFGLVQIYLPAHPEVTKEQALDPVYSVEFMAKSFSQGRHKMWSCYKMIYK